LFEVEKYANIHEIFTFSWHFHRCEHVLFATQSLVMLQTWVTQQGGSATANELQRALKAVDRDDVIESCMTSQMEEVTEVSEKQLALSVFERGVWS
jgi:hypothetical protein